MNPPVSSPATLPGFEWSQAALPEIVVAGCYPLDDRDFVYAYNGSTVHALHLYDYQATMLLCGREVALHPGDLTLSAAGGETRYHVPVPGHHWCIHFRPMRMAGASFSIPVHLSLGTLRPRIMDSIQRIAGLMAAPREDAGLARSAASAAMLELLLTLAAHHARLRERERAPRARDAAERAATLLDADLAAPPSARDMAELVGLSPNWLSRAFRDRYGTTMARYVLASRISMAQQLLQSTDLPVRRIAERLGFLDTQHLNKQFRRIAGCSPSSFRLRGSSPSSGAEG
jgi:AraC-like DNA-binding protein